MARERKTSTTEAGLSAKLKSSLKSESKTSKTIAGTDGTLSSRDSGSSKTEVGGA